MTKKQQKKLTIAEYSKLKEQRAKKRFHFQFYPWPVTLVISIPLIIIVLLLLGYILHINNIAE